MLDLSGASMIVLLSAADGAGKLAPGATFVLGDDAGLTAREMALLENAHGRGGWEGRVQDLDGESLHRVGAQRVGSAARRAADAVEE